MPAFSSPLIQTSRRKTLSLGCHALTNKQILFPIARVKSLCFLTMGQTRLHRILNWPFQDDGVISHQKQTTGSINREYDSAVVDSPSENQQTQPKYILSQFEPILTQTSSSLSHLSQTNMRHIIQDSYGL